MRQRKKLQLRAVGLTLAVVAGITLTACNPNPISAAEADFNEAIATINAQSSSWQTTLQNLESELNQEASSLATQVNSILQGAINAANNSALCDATFVGQRVEQALNNIRIINWLQSQKPSPPTPYACQSLPSSISQDQIASGGLTTVSVAGFDFNPAALDPALGTVQTTASVVSDQGQMEAEIPSQFINVQPFNVILNFSESTGFKLPADAAKVVVSFNGTGQFPIPVVGPTPQVTISNVQAVFTNGDDGKDHDSILSVTIGNGFLHYQQSGSLTFNAGTTTSVPLAPPVIPVAELADQQLQVCIQPVGNDTWRFNVAITGTTSNGGVLYILFAGQDINQDLRCTPGLTFPHTLPITTTIVPAPPPAGGGTGGGSSGGGCLLVEPNGTQALVSPEMRPTKPGPCG